MQFDLLKNPIIIGIIASIITYVYMLWDNNRKYKKNPKVTKKPINIMTPIIVGLFVWFLAYGYFDMETTKIEIENDIPEIPEIGNLAGISSFKINKGSAKNEFGIDNNDLSLSSESYELMDNTKGITVPSALPDVFIEAYE